MFKKIILAVLLSLLATNVNWAYTEVNCSSDSVFWQYSCNQCFDWEQIKTGDSISFLDDIWTNDTTNRKIMYKEEQVMPIMNVLNGASFTKNPNDDSFWEYTPEFETLNDKDFDWYVLPAGKSVSWVKSSIGASYLVDSVWEPSTNAWILVFDIMAHNILASWEIVINNKSHKECVLYKAWETVIAPEIPAEIVEPTPEWEQMTKVKTGPELYFLVLMISFLLWFVVMNKKMILSKIRK